MPRRNENARHYRHGDKTSNIRRKAIKFAERVDALPSPRRKKTRQKTEQLAAKRVQEEDGS